MHVDDIINILNKKSKFKILIFLILSLPTFQFYGQLQLILLALVKPKFQCLYNITIGEEIIESNQCYIRNIKTNITIPCTSWNFSTDPVGSTMISDFKLICDKEYYGDLILFCWYITAFSCPFMGWLADKIGRKKIAIFNLILETISSILIALSPNITINILARVLQGISTNAVFVCFSWLIEMVDSNFRPFIGSFYWFYGCLGYITIPIITYFTRDWRLTQLYALIPSFIYLFIFFVPESPRWYYVAGNCEESFEALKKIQKFNKLENEVILDYKFPDNNKYKKKSKSSLWEALKSKIFTQRLIITFALQFSTYLFYSSVTVNLNILSNNIYLSMITVGLMEAPALLLSFFSLKYISRRISILIWSSISSILFLSSIFFSRTIYWQSIIRLILGSIAKIAIAALNQGTMVYILELFPTCHRTIGSIIPQIANFLSFMGAIYINRLDKYYFFLPMVIYFTLICITCILVLITLPNTRNLPMPETFSDQAKLKLGLEKDYIEYMKNKSDNKFTNRSTSRSEDSDETSSLLNGSFK